MSSHLNHMLDDDDNDSEPNDAASAASTADKHAIALEPPAHAPHNAKCETDDRRIAEEKTASMAMLKEHNETDPLLEHSQDRFALQTTDRDDDDDDDDARTALPYATHPGVVELSVAEQVTDESDDGIETQSSLTVTDEHGTSADGGEAATAPTKFTSLVMITAAMTTAAAQVSIVPSDTTHIVSEPDTEDDNDSITLRHTNHVLVSDDEYETNSLAGYFTRSLEADSLSSTPTTKRRPIVTNHVCNDDDSTNDSDHFYYGSGSSRIVKSDCETSKSNDVTVVTGNDTLSAIVCIEDGLADDDSWVEEVS